MERYHYKIIHQASPGLWTFIQVDFFAHTLTVTPAPASLAERAILALLDGNALYRCPNSKCRRRSAACASSQMPLQTQTRRIAPVPLSVGATRRVAISGVAPANCASRRIGRSRLVPRRARHSIYLLTRVLRVGGGLLVVKRSSPICSRLSTLGRPRPSSAARARRENGDRDTAGARGGLARAAYGLVTAVAAVAAESPRRPLAQSRRPGRRHRGVGAAKDAAARARLVDLAAAASGRRARG